MKEYKPEDIRNFAVVGHASSGKTMLSEAMLACAGVINRMGSIAAGTTVSDYHDNEQHRQISVSASLMHLEWLGKKFNILDCPGYADFISEGLGALRVGDFALIVVHANAWRRRRHGRSVEIRDAKFGIPKMIVVNAFDKEETDFDKVLAQIREHYRRARFSSDRASQSRARDSTRCWMCRAMKSSLTPATRAASSLKPRHRANGRRRSTQLHKQLIEFVAESDDSLMEKFFAKAG